MDRREKHNARMRDYRKAHPERHKAYGRANYARRKHLVATQTRIRFYGLSELDAFRVSEAPGCEICGERNGRRFLVVDHNHDTGHNRGVLCDRCNLTLGNMRDDPALLRRAAEYVEQGGFGFFS